MAAGGFYPRSEKAEGRHPIKFAFKSRTSIQQPSKGQSLSAKEFAQPCDQSASPAETGVVLGTVPQPKTNTENACPLDQFLQEIAAAFKLADLNKDSERDFEDDTACATISLTDVNRHIATLQTALARLFITRDKLQRNFDQQNDVEEVLATAMGNLSVGTKRLEFPTTLPSLSSKGGAAPQGETHAARSNISGVPELMAVAVADTNQLLEHLDSIDALLKLGKIQIVIPWRVLDELEKIQKVSDAEFVQKDANADAALGFRMNEHTAKANPRKLRARQASRFLHSQAIRSGECDGRPPSLVLQTQAAATAALEEQRSKSSSRRTRNSSLNDWEILSCALHYADGLDLSAKRRDGHPSGPCETSQTVDERMSQRPVWLLTEDKGLRLKAEAEAPSRSRLGLCSGPELLTREMATAESREMAKIVTPELLARANGGR
eukprot:TRINITY_DN9094_c0_g2_i1.p1 TRINITY_DN9094_c0_g2~~TRINITY_DN9094_c0_g2_i1.p1  ORF type:complete len:436 (-),score=63.60 TRINITY_DN9094_c0_g2_i1:24-1331(-)